MARAKARRLPAGAMSARSVHLHPEARRLLDVLQASALPSYESLTRPKPVRWLEPSRRRTLPHAQQAGAIEDRESTAPGGPLACRIYRTDPRPDASTLPFFHRGGWVLCDLDTHDGICQQLCSQARAQVISVDYCLAPEHPFPAAVEDCNAALAWLNPRSTEVDPAPKSESDI